LYLSDALELNIVRALQLVDRVSEVVQDDGALVQDVDDAVVFTARDIFPAKRRRRQASSLPNPPQRFSRLCHCVYLSDGNDGRTPNRAASGSDCQPTLMQIACVSQCVRFRYARI